MNVSFVIECYQCHTEHHSDESTEPPEGWVRRHIPQPDGALLQVEVCPDCVNPWSVEGFRSKCLKQHLRIGKISDLLEPGYSACGKCHTNWQFVKNHTTKITSGSAVFPLCEWCWRELSPKDRLPYYIDLFNRYSPWNFTLEQMKVAVLNEQAAHPEGQAATL